MRGAEVVESPDIRQGRSWGRAQRLKNDAIYLVVRMCIALAGVAPKVFLRLACSFLALTASLSMPRTRARVRDTLAAGLGEQPSSSRVRAAFRAAGLCLADMLALYDPNERAGRTLRMHPESRRAFREALDAGRGVVFLSAHLGPWERMAALLVEDGFPVATVARESYDPRLTAAVYERLRAPRGVRSIYRGSPGAAMAIVRELSAGRAVGFLVDLPGRVPSAPCRLFGQERALPVGPARIALGRRAEVVLGTCAGGVVTITHIETGDLQATQEGEAALSARVATELILRIRGCPDAWLGLFG